MDLRNQQPRNALFSMATPLVVGDSSHNYQTVRKERSEVGRTKGMTVNKCGGTKETFEKFSSAAIGEPYQDPGQYIMRQSRNKPKSVAKPWVQSGSNKLVRKSEFQYIESGPPPRPKPETLPRFKTHVKAEPFTNGNNIGYAEDPYERRQDQERVEYAVQNWRILHRDQPWSNTVRQRGTFYPVHKTFGTHVEFPEKKAHRKDPPLFGSFKAGDPLKTGHNKCIGKRNGTSEEAYVEEMEQDKLYVSSYSAKKPSVPWVDVSTGKSMMNASTLLMLRNVNQERAQIAASTNF